MTSFDIRVSQLFELCELALKDLGFMGVTETNPAGEYTVTGLVDKLVNILRLHASVSQSSQSSQNNNQIGFSAFTAWFVARVAGELGSGLDVRTALHKNSPLDSSYSTMVTNFFAKAQNTPVQKEFLVDYFISLPDKKHAPILTAESEANENCNFDDLSKLLLVHSPRRLYIANINNHALSGAATRISTMLNEALSSGVLSPSDQIVFLLYQQDGAGFKLHLYDFDQYRHCK